jgi:hypothetical protein
MDYPIRRTPPPRREKRLVYKPGQTVGLCNICRIYRVFEFTPALTCRCTTCGWEISLEEVQGA